MTEKNAVSSEEEKQAQEPEQQIQFHVPQELEYVYRDVFNVYAGVGEVVIEFGNHHRSMPEYASISNRIVVSVGNAYVLLQTLQKTLQEAQAAIQHGLKNQRKE